MCPFEIAIETVFWKIVKNLVSLDYETNLILARIGIDSSLVLFYVGIFHFGVWISLQMSSHLMVATEQLRLNIRFSNDDMLN